MKKFLLILIFIAYQVSLAQSFEIYNQDTINLIDANNLKQGHWIFFGRMKKLPNYADDAKVEEGKFVDSKKTGKWIKYFPSGKVENEITFQNGRPNGYYINYYENGKVQEEGTWVNNKQVGNFKRYHENGVVSQEFKFNEGGKREGMQKYYYENGQLMIEGEFVDGKEAGVIKEYYENGDLKAEKVFNGGSLDVAATKVYEPKKPIAVKKEEPIKDAPPAPVVTKSSEVSLSGVFNGNGYAKLFNANRQVSKDGTFLNYKLIDGKEYIYDKNGILQKIQIYKDGKYVGDGVIENTK
jgi:antitoxin component YwqK of YwqJK toxin-antitoxin module